MKTKIMILIALCLLAGFLPKLHSQCSPTGLLAAEAIANLTNIGSVTWTNTSDANTSDNIRCSAGTLVNALSTVSTNYLYASNLNLIVPPSAFVCGVQVQIEHRQTGFTTGYSVRDNIVQLMKGGQLVGVNKASSLDWSAIDETFVYGGPFDMWGAGLTPGDLNSAGFGVALSATLRGGANTSMLSADIDAIAFTVYYALPLPVEFTYFVADPKSPGGVALSWQTAVETNNRCFAVERSADGRQFKEIGVVKGAGNTAVAHRYQFMDENPFNGHSYYRIKQSDFNGHASYSEMQVVSYLHKASVSSAQATQEGFLLKVNVPDPTALLIQVMNVAGEHLLTSHQDVRAGKSDIRVDAGNLESGIYFIKCRLPDSEYIQKVYLLRE